MFLSVINTINTAKANTLKLNGLSVHFTASCWESGGRQALTVDSVDRGDVRHAVLIGFSALRRGFGERQSSSRAPPGISPSRWCSQEVPACLAPPSLAGLGVEVPVLHQPGMVQSKAIAEGTAIWELPVCTGQLVLRARPLWVQELWGGSIRQGTSTPLTVMVRFRSLSVESRILKPKGQGTTSITNKLAKQKRSSFSNYQRSPRPKAVKTRLAVSLRLPLTLNSS